MQSVEHAVRNAADRHERGSLFVRDVCQREGASNVVRAVTELVRSRAEGHGEALLFLMEAADGLGAELLPEQRVPELEEAIRASTEFAGVIEDAGGGVYRDRSMAALAFTRLPLHDARSRLESFAVTCHARGDVVTLGEVFAQAAVPSLLPILVASPDPLDRWALLPWTNADTRTAMADAVRRRLASDPCRWVAAEAAQHLRILEASTKGGDGWSFHVVSNHGSAPSFRSVTRRFVDGWAPGKSDYTKEELRAFVVRELGAPGS